MKLTIHVFEKIERKRSQRRVKRGELDRWTLVKLVNVPNYCLYRKCYYPKAIDDHIAMEDAEFTGFQALQIKAISE